MGPLLLVSVNFKDQGRVWKELEITHLLMWRLEWTRGKANLKFVLVGLTGFWVIFILFRMTLTLACDILPD